MDAVVLLSGGMDSTTALAQALRDGAETVLALTFDYGSMHALKEQAAAKRVVEHYQGKVKGRQVIHQTFSLNEIMFHNSGSSLMGESEIPDEEYHDVEKESPSSTVVPYRNAVLISNAVAFAASRKYDRVYVAVHASDAQGFAYPDCTPEFIGNMVSAAYIGTHKQVRLVSPFQWMTKSEIVERAVNLWAPLQLTWSCYRGWEIACGNCPTCRERIQAFREAGYEDPIPYSIPVHYELTTRSWPLE